jgi:hypothetical protein
MFDKSIQILLMHVAKLLNVHNASFLSGEKDAFLSRKWGIKSINFSCANRFTMPFTMLHDFSRPQWRPPLHRQDSASIYPIYPVMM